MVSVLGLQLTVSFYSICLIIVLFFIGVFIIDWLFYRFTDPPTKSPSIIQVIIHKIDLIRMFIKYFAYMNLDNEDRQKINSDLSSSSPNGIGNTYSSLTYDPQDILHGRVGR